MGFGSMIHRSTTGEVRKQDQVMVKDHLGFNSKMVMNPDGTCDVEGTVIVKGLGLKSLNQLTPRVRRISGNFWCDNNELTSLEGCPEEVGGVFDCSCNKLTTLKGSPKKVQIFRCEKNSLFSLEGSPECIDVDFICNNNMLTTFKGGLKKLVGHSSVRTIHQNFLKEML